MMESEKKKRTAHSTLTYQILLEKLEHKGAKLSYELSREKRERIIQPARPCVSS